MNMNSSTEELIREAEQQENELALELAARIPAHRGGEAFWEGKKLVAISHCGQCRWYEHLGSRAVCNHDQGFAPPASDLPARKHGEAVEIPRWCPLPDVGDE